MTVNKYILMFILVFRVAGAVQNDPFAPQAPNDSGGNTTVNPNDFSNGISTGIFNGMAADPNSVKDNVENKSRGREYKAGDAQAQGNNGSGVHAGIGAAMIATGSVMAASPDIPTAVAGWDLIAKGGLELAQSAADRSSANNNGDQKKLLMNNSDTRFGSTGAPAAKPQVNSPELDKMLSESGVNSEDFKNRLVNGEFQSAGDILNALGKKDISAEDLAAGQLMGDSQAKNLMGLGTNGEPNNALLTSNENAISNSGASNPDASISGGGSDAVPTEADRAASGVETRETASGARGLASLAEGNGASQKGLRLGSRNADGAAAGHTAGALFDVNQLIRGALGEGSSQEDHHLAKAIVRQDLFKMGIHIAVPGQNIFDTAHRNYGNFGKWRKKEGRFARR